jgi:hypothetical protein
MCRLRIGDYTVMSRLLPLKIFIRIGKIILSSVIKAKSDSTLTKLIGARIGNYFPTISMVATRADSNTRESIMIGLSSIQCEGDIVQTDFSFLRSRDL